MAKKRKRTPEEIADDEARQAQLEAMVAERIAYHEAKAREEEHGRRRAAG